MNLSIAKAREERQLPPSTEEINAATRIIDLESALKNAKTKDHDKIWDTGAPTRSNSNTGRVVSNMT